MGCVRTHVLIGDAGKRKVKEVVFLVDTGAFFPVIPLYLAKELGIEPLAKTRLLMTDNREAAVNISLAYFRVLDREGIFPVVLMDSPEPLLGAVVLEGLRINVNFATSRLEYSRPYGLALLSIISNLLLYYKYSSFN
jgi:predicted aspartyl protease